MARRRRGGLRGRPDAPVARRDRGRVGGRAARAQAKGARQRVRRDASRVVPQSEPRPEPEAAVRDRRVPRRGPGEDQEVLGALLAPTGEDTPIGRFLKKKGPGIQQIAFRVDLGFDRLLSKLKSEGIRLINETPTEGANGSRIVFVHPSSTGGVLVELVQYYD